MGRYHEQLEVLLQLLVHQVHQVHLVHQGLLERQLAQGPQLVQLLAQLLGVGAKEAVQALVPKN